MSQPSFEFLTLLNKYTEVCKQLAIAEDRCKKLDQDNESLRHTVETLRKTLFDNIQESEEEDEDEEEEEYVPPKKTPKKVAKVTLKKAPVEEEYEEDDEEIESDELPDDDPMVMASKSYNKPKTQKYNTTEGDKSDFVNLIKNNKNVQKRKNH